MPDPRLPTLEEVVQDLAVRRRLFRRLPLLAEVETAICHKLADAAHHIHRASGEQVIGRGDPPDQAYLVLTGLVHITRVSEINDICHLSYRGPSQPFGVHNMVAAEPHTYTTRVVKDCDLLRLDRVPFLDCVNRSPVLRRNLFRHLNRRFFQTAEKWQRTMRLRARGARLLGELLEILQALQVRIIASPPSSGESIDWLDRKKLADQFGCDRRIVLEALQKLERAGLLTRDRSGTITVRWDDVLTLGAVYDHLDACNLAQAIALVVNGRDDPK